MLRFERENASVLDNTLMRDVSSVVIVPKDIEVRESCSMAGAGGA